LTGTPNGSAPSLLNSSYTFTADIEVPEGGVRFRVPLAGGQKTGWFFDQTANRAAVAAYAKGARVLDVCSSDWRS